MKENCEKTAQIAVSKYIIETAKVDINQRKSFKHHLKLILKGVWVSLMITLYAYFIDKGIPYNKITLVVTILFIKDKVIDISKIKKNRKKILEQDKFLQDLLKNVNN